MAISPLLFSVNLWASQAHHDLYAKNENPPQQEVQKKSAEDVDKDLMSVPDICNGICDEIWSDIHDEQVAKKRVEKLFGGTCQMICHEICDAICDGII